MDGLHLIGGDDLNGAVRVAQRTKGCRLWPTAKTPLTPTIGSTHVGTLMGCWCQEIVKVGVKVWS